MLNKRVHIINNWFKQRPLVKDKLLKVKDKEQYLKEHWITNKGTLNFILNGFK